jgi:pyruvate/2-oxoglutarate dehydrogenase complex dihydrolipoamide acyltransferase (E2) component
VLALLIRATELAVREVPEVNGFFTDGAFRPSSSVHVGVAIALRQGGLVAPALHDADIKDLDAPCGHVDLLGRSSRERRAPRRSLSRGHPSTSEGARAAMNTDEAREVLAQVLGQIAPEVDLTRVAVDAELQLELDLDSMDFLNLVTGIHEMTGVDVPERDYPLLHSIEGCARYLVEHSSSEQPG